MKSLYDGNYARSFTLSLKKKRGEKQMDKEKERKRGDAN